MASDDPQALSMLDRAAVFVIASMQHRRFAKRLRTKTARLSDRAALTLEADEMVREILGPFPDEEGFDPEDFDREPHAQAVHMKVLSEAMFDDLQETESYAWGLAITGVYHLWERDLQKVLKGVGVRDPTLHEAGFCKLRGYVGDAGFDFAGCPQHDPIRDTSLIANTVKHGEGKSCKKLMRLRPGLFRDKRAASLRVGEREFDSAFEAIDRFWVDFEAAFSARHRPGRKPLFDGA